MSDHATRAAYAKQTAYSDPREFAGLLDPIPDDIDAISHVVRNVIVHYRAGGVPIPDDRMPEIDSRWVDRILGADQARFGGRPLDAERPFEQRVPGCCRDHSLLTVAILRHKGIPARTRIGFAGYFTPGWHHDHVVVDYWTGQRWAFADPELEPSGDWGFDPHDMPRLTPDAPFLTAAQAWKQFRAGEIDAQTFGVAPEVPFRGGSFIRDYVIFELAHRRGNELLLWDVFGGISPSLDADESHIDRVADLLLAADAGDGEPESALAEVYATDSRFRPGAQIVCMSPRGVRSVVDLASRTVVDSGPLGEFVPTGAPDPASSAPASSAPASTAPPSTAPPSTAPPSTAPASSAPPSTVE